MLSTHRARRLVAALAASGVIAAGFAGVAGTADAVAQPMQCWYHGWFEAPDQPGSEIWYYGWFREAC
jgi:hypothetical protein